MPGSQIPPAPPSSGSFWAAPLLGVTVPDSPIFSAADTARLLGFPTREALAKARRTGRLSIKMFQIPGRRGWFARREEVCAWLHQSLNSEEEAR